MPEQTESQPLRFAFIGCAASIMPSHLKALAQLPGAQLVGMADADPERGAQQAAESRCLFFQDHRLMLADTQPDVTVICTPHPSHMALALDCFAAGSNVLVEKPIADEVSAADRMIEAAQAAGKLLAVCFQQRFRPAVEYMRQFVADGQLGELVRVLCIQPWFRSAAYYNSASWRASWRGEGGGVLLNQGPHTLDLLCHVIGMPKTVMAWTRTLRHAIETEDTAQAMLEYHNGALGYVHINTVEAGASLHIQIVGNRGALELLGNQLTVCRFKPGLREHMLTSSHLFASPEVERNVVTLPSAKDGHLSVYQDLDSALRRGGVPRTTGQEALLSLELANAILLSGQTNRPASLPLPRGDYSAMLEQLRRASDARPTRQPRAES